MQSSMLGAIEGCTKDEHSYAYTQRKRACEGKEKDHCYTTRSAATPDLSTCDGWKPKTGVHKEHSYSTRYSQYRSLHSTSEEDISDYTENPLFLKDPYYLLPHYQSSDSALDVTGFDSISEKCLSSEHLNVKTVDVLTDRCILQGKSDPDISKMTLQSLNDFEKSLSLPNSPSTPDIEERMILDHTYSTFSKANGGLQSDKSSCYWSPLQDHSYDMSLKRRSVHGGIKRGRSIDNMDYLPSVSRQMSASDFTKSPFLDHTYQSVELKNKKSQSQIPTTSVGKPSCFQDLYKNKKPNKGFIHLYDDDKVNETMMFKRPIFDHTYEKTNSVSKSDKPSTNTIGTRFRSNSLTEHVQGQSDIDSDHASMDDGSDSLSDSGTESLNEETSRDVPMMTEQTHGRVQNDDHSYVYKATL